MLRSVMPTLLGRDWSSRDLTDYPTIIAEDIYGMGLDELPTLYTRPPAWHRRRLQRQEPDATAMTTGYSEVKNDPNKFQISMDVSQFAPNEIEVKTVNNCVVVHGKHAEKPDALGYISREFTRRYVLPNDAQAENVTSSMTVDGTLIVEVPKNALTAANERAVPITMRDASGDGQ